MFAKYIIKLIQKSLDNFNLRIVKSDNFFDLAKTLSYNSEVARNELLKIGLEVHGLQSLITYSCSQIGQDLFVISRLKGKKNGYFIEFGASDGVSFSNTFLLEKDFRWKGILVEPGKNWIKDLEKNRSCIIDNRCVASDSNGSVQFCETTIPELSTIQGFEKRDEHKRLVSNSYNVKKVSLNDLLIEYNAPRIIDYLSIDTEGSEFLILNNFDFNKYQFRVITCEHNFTENREKIHNLLTENGYKRIWPEFTQFDDWYVHPELI